jgi:hypothetical protein
MVEMIKNVGGSSWPPSRKASPLSLCSRESQSSTSFTANQSHSAPRTHAAVAAAAEEALGIEQEAKRRALLDESVSPSTRRAKELFADMRDDIVDDPDAVAVIEDNDEWSADLAHAVSMLKEDQGGFMGSLQVHPEVGRRGGSSSSSSVNSAVGISYLQTDGTAAATDTELESDLKVEEVK